MLITIKNVKRGILSLDEFRWLRRNLNKPLKVMSLTFDYKSGKLWHISIYRPGATEEDDFTCISLFTDRNEVQYELGGPL